MGSLFVVVCPTRVHEMGLRQKEEQNELQTFSNPESERNSSIHFGLPNQPSLGLVSHMMFDDEEILSKLNRPESKVSEMDIRNLIDTVFLEKHLEETMKKYHIYHAVVIETVDEKMFQATFTVPQTKAEKIIHHLQTCGFGSKYESTICVSGGDVYIAEEKKEHKEDTGDNHSDDGSEDEQTRKKGHWNDFVASIKSRLTVAQVVQSVTNNAAITFDYMMMIFVAATIAALGLLENSSVALVASMLISPLMSPIMAFVFSFVIHDKNLMKLGASGAAIGLFQCLIVGFIFGVSIESKPFQGPWAHIPMWPTGEMTGRAQYRSLIVGAFIAIPSGIGVALSMLAGNSGSLVGVAISASLLPPAVNCVNSLKGVFWGMSVVVGIKEVYHNSGSVNVRCNEYLGGNHSTYFFGHYPTFYCKNAVKEFAMMGTMSLLLTIINIFLIFIFGIIILRIKEFAPYTTRKNLKRFWTEDLKAVREYNTAHGGVMREEDILKDINAVEDPEALKNNLANDATLCTINKKTGRTIQDLSLYGTRKAPELAPLQVTPVIDQQPPGGWFSWFKKPPEYNNAPEEVPVVVEERTGRKIIIRRRT